MGVVDQPVEDGIAKRGVVDHFMPVIDAELAGDQGGLAADAVFGQFRDPAVPGRRGWPAPSRRGSRVSGDIQKSLGPVE